MAEHENVARRAVPRLLPVALAATLTALVLVLGLHAGSAEAGSKIYGFTSVPSTTQAGGHPDVFTEFELGNRFTQNETDCNCNDPKDIIQHIPPGVIANPHVVSICPAALLSVGQCPSDSQAGLVVIKLFTYVAFPLYRTIPQHGQAALFVFTIANQPQYLAFNSRTGSDYGLDARSIGISHIKPLLFTGPIFWGVPGEHFNDFMRFRPGEEAIGCEFNPMPAMQSHNEAAIKNACPQGTSKSNPSSLPIAPMMQNPTVCAGPMTSSLEVTAYDLETEFGEAPWPATTGCDALTFDPSLAANPTTTNTDSPSGLEVTLKVPQFQDPKVPSPSELKANTVTLPEGFSLNPNAADGKTSCSDIQSAVGTEEEAQCPEESKVGTVLLDSSALPAPISGYIYLGEPKPGAPYRLVLTANGFGTAVKLLGTIHADPRTGRLVSTFEDLPQTPFQEFVLHFFGSERGLLATPTQCGTYPVESEFVPWDGALSKQTQTQFFVLDHGPDGAPCPDRVRGFSPDFEGGVKDNTGGADTSLGLRVTRPDGDQNLSALTVETPPGLLASIKGVPYCPETAIDQLSHGDRTGRAELAGSACPAASRIGQVTAGSGAGSRPLYSPGSVYLAGPYKGAPLSLLSVVPAVTGPYDFGNVVVRSALEVDPRSAEITTVTDELPHILEGAPLRLRMIQIDLDRRRFVRNPTDCTPSALDAAIHGDQGAIQNRSAFFQVANCADLPYAPKLSLKMTGGVNRRGHPAIKATLKAAAGESNTERISVALPPGEQLDNAHIGDPCTRVEFAADRCPASSVIGSAVADTPLLDEPLRGNVYLRSSSHRLPDMVVDLRGQIDVELVGVIDTTRRGALRTTFTAPDAAISSFVLSLQGGKKGLIQNSKSLCGKPRKAKVRMTGQNGRPVNRGIQLEVGCGAKKKTKRGGRR